MLPPKEDAQGNYSTGLYNWGGCLMNLILSAICFVGWFALGTESIPAVCLLLAAIFYLTWLYIHAIIDSACVGRS